MRITLFFILFLAPAIMFAQTPETYFHNSAKLYLEDKDQQAALMLDEAIKKYPQDTVLKAFRKMIKIPPPQPQTPSPSQSQQARAIPLSKEQMERLLQALNQEEQKVQVQVGNGKTPIVEKKTGKDW